MLRCHKINSTNSFLSKAVLLLFLFSFSKSWGQATLPVSRVSWATTPTGWTDGQGGSPTYGSDICGGSDGTSGRLDNTGENFVVNYNAVASSLSFCMQGNGFSGGTFSVEESVNGSTWTNVQSYTTISATPSIRTLNLNCASRFVRFIYTTKSAGNVQLDNVSIVTGTCVTCSAPTTTISPTTQTVCAGAITTISVSSSATSPSYTWQASANGSTGWAQATNSTPVSASYSGVNTDVLTITTGSTYYYRCLVAEGGTCTATSATSTLVVNTSPTITTQPINKTICSGSNTSFTVATSGAPLTYQWQENTGSGYSNIANGGVYSGVLTATLILTAPPAAMNTYSYQCVVSSSSGCGTVTSTAAILTVNQTPAAPPVPTPLANPACSSTSLSAMSSTVAGVTWYWQGTSSTSSVTTQNTNTDYNVTASGNYYVRAQSNTGNCWSAASVFSVTVNTPVTITSGASNKGVCTGINTTMDITGAAATKQWYVSTDNGVTFNPVTANAVYTGGITNNNNLSITNAPVSYNGNQYYCVVSVAGCPTLTSSIGVLTVTQTPAAPPVPIVLANPACVSTSLTAMSSTVAGVTWYWQGTTSGGSSTTNPTSSAYGVTSSGTYYVRARTDGSSCLSPQSSTVITINQPPAITTQPTDRTQCVGTNTIFSVSATNVVSYQWQVNTGSGFVNLTNVAPHSNVTTANLSVTGITAGMNGYLYQCIVNGSSPCAAVTSSVAILNITASGAPTSAASSPLTNGIACNAFNLSWTSGSGSNRLVVVSTSPVSGSPVNGTNYTANASFGSGGTIAAGEFVVYKGSGNHIYITGLSASTTYYYKIFEYNGCSLNYLTTGTIPNGNETTISCTSTPGLTGVYINACEGSCGYEGNNELIWGLTGSYGLNVNNNGPTLDYVGTTQISNYVLNASVINSLNAATGSCTNTVFVDPNTLGYIPANSNFLIANSCMCIPSVYDLSGLCNSGPIYVVFGSNASWACNTNGGIFGNPTSGTVKDFDIDFSPWGVAVNPSYSFTPSSLSATDGAAITLNPNGGAATGYFNSGCAVPLTILPIELIDFYATQDGNKNDLIWKVASEKNVSQYMIEKSEDGVNFIEMSRVNSLDNEAQAITYMTEDTEPYSGITYYRLNTIESSGKINKYKIIDIDRANKNWKSLLYQTNNNLIIEFKNAIPKNAQVVVFDLSGQQIEERNIEQSQTKINTDNLSTGIYFVRISSPYKTENFKIIIQK
jgi:hypothetical protein